MKLRPRPEAEGACWATFPALAGAAEAAAVLAASELGPTALVLLDARAAQAAAAGAGLPPSPLPTVLVAFDGLARAVAWQGDETARRLRAAGARAVDVLDAGGRRGRSRRCGRRAGSFRTRSRSRPSACCPPRWGRTSTRHERRPRPRASSWPRSRRWGTDR